MNINKEIELKIEISEEIYSALMTQFPITKTVLQENWFLDTSEQVLHLNHWALRLRFQEGKIFLTAKGPKAVCRDEQIRPEYEVELTLTEGESIRGGIKLSADSYLPINILYEKFGNIKLLPLLHFSNERIYMPWQDWTLELDKTIIGDKIFYELEIETEITIIEKLKKQIINFFSDHGWEYKYSKTDKFTRACKILL